MAGEERDLTNRDDSRPVRVKVDNVKKILIQEMVRWLH